MVSEGNCLSCISALCSNFLLCQWNFSCFLCIGARRLTASRGCFERVFIFDGDGEAATIAGDDSGVSGTIRLNLGFLFRITFTMAVGEGGMTE